VRRAGTHRTAALSATTCGSCWTSAGGRKRYTVRIVKNIVTTMKPTISCTAPDASRRGPSTSTGGQIRATAQAVDKRAGHACGLGLTNATIATTVMFCAVSYLIRLRQSCTSKAKAP
jgi:hypothetical protein